MVLSVYMRLFYYVTLPPILLLFRRSLFPYVNSVYLSTICFGVGGSMKGGISERKLSIYRIRDKFCLLPTILDPFNNYAIRRIYRSNCCLHSS